MAQHTLEGELYAGEDNPLIAEDYGGTEQDMLLSFDASGALTTALPAGALPRTGVPPVLLTRPCTLRTLNGSWFIQLTPTVPHILSRIRGPMRIEADDSVLRISGDIYVKQLILPPLPAAAGPRVPETLLEPIVPGALVIHKNWYPAFPQDEYRWYFRSTGCTYAGGTLTFTFERHLWNRITQQFTQSDTGSMELKCSGSLIRPIGAPQPTIQMTGTATIGRQQYNVNATKSSPYYRGCLVEVDVMQSRTWAASASSCDGSQTFKFTGIYREAGLDFRVQVDALNVPEDPQLTRAELHNLLASHRTISAGGDNWHVWLYVGSREDGTFGVMFDTGNPPHREGAVGFFDVTLPNLPIIEAAARGQRLGEVPLAFLRTLVHEACHAFNLFHPKHDVHSVPIGKTIMNQTGDVMGFSTVANPYPCNATMAFDDHNRTSLIHSPDPQVKPGWKEFGWGHGAVWSGIAEPVDVVGLGMNAPDAKGLRLTISLPTEITRGEVVFATATVTNEDTAPRWVYGRLNLAERDLRINVTPPDGDTIEVNDVVLVCGEHQLIELQPGASASSTFQLFYTNRGFTFDQPGQYVLEAELDTADADGSVVRSQPVIVFVRQGVSEAERDLGTLTLDKDVGLAIALGDFPANPAVEDKLTTVATRYADTDTGAAAAFVLANTLAHDFRDARTGITLRAADRTRSEQMLDSVMSGRDATTIAQLTIAVISPREVTAPLLGLIQSRLRMASRGADERDDLSAARKILSDFIGEGKQTKG